jgi:hypothetical protein
MERFASELVETVETVSKKLVTISEEAAASRPSSNEWSQKEIVGHLIDSASNNHHRFVRAQQEAELIFPPYAQEQWVKLQDHNGNSWRRLVALFRLYNLHLAHIIRCIPAKMHAAVCRIGSNKPATLAFLVEDYLRHLKQHVKQLGL